MLVARGTTRFSYGSSFEAQPASGPCNLLQANLCALALRLSYSGLKFVKSDLTSFTRIFLLSLTPLTL